MAFRARKVFGTFEKRAPGLEYWALCLTCVKFVCSQLCSENLFFLISANFPLNSEQHLNCVTIAVRFRVHNILTWEQLSRRIIIILFCRLLPGQLLRMSRNASPKFLGAGALRDIREIAAKETKNFCTLSKACLR